MSIQTYCVQLELQQAARVLAERCDGAMAQDGQGFSAFDAKFGRYLALESSPWSPRALHNAWRMIRKYRNQLRSYGFDFESVPVPPVPSEELPVFHVNAQDSRKIDVVGGAFHIAFPYHGGIVAAVKEVIGRQYVSTPTPHWVSPFNSASSLLEMAREHDFCFTPAAEAAIKENAGNPVRTIDWDGSMFIVRFPKSMHIIEALRNIPSAAFNGSNHSWEVPLTTSSMIGLVNVAMEHDFAVPDDFFDIVGNFARSAHESINKSWAMDTDFRVEGLPFKLWGYQHAGVEYIIEMKSAFLGDDQGTGKTIQALAAIHHTQAFPVVIFCPSSVAINWAKEAAKWLPSLGPMQDISICKGHKPDTVLKPIKTSGLVIPVNKYDAKILICGYAIASYHADLLFVRDNVTVICDESHYIKNPEAKRTAAIFKCVKEATYRWLLTGTPMKSRPLELEAQLKALGYLDQFGGSWKFRHRYCDPRHDGYGWSFKGASNMDELREKLRSMCMIRRLKKDVLPDLPPKIWSDIPVEIDNRKEYERAAKDIIEYIYQKVLEDPSYWNEVVNQIEEGGIPIPDGAWKSEDQAAFVRKYLREMAKDKSATASRAIHLVEISVLRQLSAQGKFSGMAEFLESLLESGEKVVIFASHKKIQHELRELFPGSAHVLGEDSMETRQRNIESFQQDGGPQVIVCSLQAAGEGITLTAASNLVFVEQGWTPGQMDQASDRIHRIGQEADSVNIYNMIGVDTIDEYMVSLINRKRKVIHEITDGGGSAEGTGASILSDLIEEMRGR